MAAADDIISDLLNIKIAKTIPLNSVDEVFVGLGFSQTEVEKIVAQNRLGSQIDGACRDMLSTWKNQHGSGLNAAEELKAVMEENKVTEAVTLIQKAIEKVYPAIPQGEPLTVDMETESTKPTTDKPSRTK